MTPRFTVEKPVTGAGVVVMADGWPLLLICPNGEVAVNDLRRSAAFVRRWQVPMLRNSPGEAVVVAALQRQRLHEVVVSVDGRALARVRLDPDHPTLAEVAIRDPDTGAEVADVAVRYRQVGLDHGGGLPGPGLTGR